MDKDKYIIYDLDSEIKKVQIIRKYGNYSNKEEKMRITKAIIPLIKKNFMNIKPVYWFLFVAINYFFPSLLGILFSVLMLSKTVLLKSYCEYREMANRRKLDKIKIIPPEEFYYEEFKYATALYNHVSEDERKYNEALEKQQKDKIREEKEVDYTKEDEINLLVEAIEDYFYCYKLPPLKIRNYEWDAFFDILYREFEIRGIKDEYFHAVSEVIRYTLANILVNNADSIQMQDFVYNLCYLCESNSNRGILPKYFDYQAVENIQSRIKLKIRSKRRKEVKKYRKEL